MRAQAVHDYFVSKDVNPARLVAMGKGQTEPIATNDSDAGRRENRRVENSGGAGCGEIT